MYAVTGITGRVGGVTGRTLQNAGLSVRAVVRDAAKGAAWKQRGCEVAVADINDAPALTAAFTGVSGVFVLLPSNFDPTPGFPEAKAIITTVTTAIEAAKPPKVVCLSTIGAGNAAESAQSARFDGAVAGRPADAGVFPTTCLVHGKCVLGRRTGP